MTLDQINISLKYHRAMKRLEEETIARLIILQDEARQLESGQISIFEEV